MHNKRTIVSLLTCMFLATGVWCVGKEEASSPEALISRARLEEGIWTEGTPPMSMRAEIQVSDGKRPVARGDYSFYWASPSRWREEIRIGNYERVRVGGAKGYWQKSGLSYQPEIGFQLDALLHVKDALRVGWNRTLGKVKTREKDGVRQKCTEVKWTGGAGTERIMCFAEASGALLSVEYPRGEHQNPPEMSRIEYSAFATVGGKTVPYEIRALNDRKVIAAVRVLEIKRITEENPVLFSAPMNSEFWPQCDDMQEAQLVDRVQPRYPASARTNHEKGRVVFYAVIEESGSLSHLTVIHRATPDLEAAALEAVRRWHYKPASCAQTPIRVETSIATDFWLEY